MLKGTQKSLSKGFKAVGNLLHSPGAWPCCACCCAACCWAFLRALSLRFWCAAQNLRFVICLVQPANAQLYGVGGLRGLPRLRVGVLSATTDERDKFQLISKKKFPLHLYVAENKKPHTEREKERECMVGISLGTATLGSVPLERREREREREGRGATSGHRRKDGRREKSVSGVREGKRCK